MQTVTNALILGEDGETGEQAGAVGVVLCFWAVEDPREVPKAPDRVRQASQLTAAQGHRPASRV